jgi:hypothetical protein
MKSRGHAHQKWQCWDLAATGSGLEVGYRLPVAGWAGDVRLVSPGGCFSQIIAGMGSMLHILDILSGIRAIWIIWNIRFRQLEAEAAEANNAYEEVLLREAEQQGAKRRRTDAGDESDDDAGGVDLAAESSASGLGLPTPEKACAAAVEATADS